MYNNIKFYFLALIFIVLGCTNSIEKSTNYNKLENQVLGKWINYQLNVTYNFYDDLTWRKSYYSEGKIVVKKGKYVVATDSAIFLRYYGSRHWIVNDTVNDIKTSMDSQLLFFKDSITIINNQEDYELYYKKVTE